jgi:hypothetical protein
MFRWIALISAIVLVVSFVCAIVSSQPSLEPLGQQDGNQNEKEQPAQKKDIALWNRFFPDSISLYTLFLVVFTAVLAGGGIYQLKFLETTERIAADTAKAAKDSAQAALAQNKISTDTLVYSQRAFMNMKGFQVFHVYDTTQNNRIIAWRFTPLWENTGQTPTKKLNVITGIHPGEFEEGFNFKIDRAAPSMLGPKGILTGESYLIGLPEIYEIKAGKRIVYIWGRAEYNDVFPNTRRHYINFCHKIVVAGDPTIQESGIQMIAHNTIGNYTDEDEER